MKIVDTTAYFDESRLDAAFPFVAGFWAVIDVWEDVDKEIRKALENKPRSLTAKKYLRGEPVLFSAIFKKHCLQPIHASVEKKVIDNLIRTPKDWEKFPLWTDVYATCAYMCCEKLDKRMAEINPQNPVKVIFDKGTEGSQHLDRGYRRYYAKKSPTYLAPSPAFDDEENVMPLLAADLYAWLMAKERNESPKEAGHEVNRALVEIHRVQPLRAVVTEAAIKHIMGHEQSKTPR